MESVYYYYYTIKNYIVEYFYTKPILSIKQIEWINNKENLKEKYKNLNIHNMYYQLHLMSPYINKTTNIDRIIEYLNNKLSYNKSIIETPVLLATNKINHIELIGENTKIIKLKNDFGFLEELSILPS